MTRLLIAPLIWLGMAHAVVDATTGYLLFSQLHHSQMMGLFLLYNGGAFVLQPMVGAWIDHWGIPKAGVFASLALLVLAIGLYMWQLVAAIAVAALASALFHVGAGTLAVALSPGLTMGSAFFTAPGVLGLGLGMLAATQTIDLLTPLAGACLLLLLTGWFLIGSQKVALKPPLQLDDSLLLVLLGAIALRSFLWTGSQQWVENSPELLLSLALGAAGGKWMGGWMADRWGGAKTMRISLLFAIPCLLSGAHYPMLLVLGVALLQTSTPVLLTAMVSLGAATPATSAGLALGFAIALGGIPNMMQYKLTATAWFCVVPMMGILLFMALGWSLKRFESSV